MHPQAARGRHEPTVVGLFAVAAAASIVAALTIGTFPISLLQLVETLFIPIPGVVRDVVWELRVPRAAAAFGCGALLALAGALLQVLLRNPLADSYLLGVSGGASLGALGAMAAGAGLAAIHFCGFAGAVGAIALLVVLARLAGDWNVYRLILTGVVLSAGLSAVVSLVLLTAPEAQTKSMLFWLMGDLSLAGSPWPALVLAAVLSAGAAAFGIRLDLLALGDFKARSLGLDAAGLQIVIFAAAALATVAAVLLGGTIGFVGLLTPHAVRLLGITRHRLLVPLAALGGGTLLTVADTVARLVWAPQQLPVGVITALVGVPAMLFLLRRSPRAVV